MKPNAVRIAVTVLLTAAALAAAAVAAAPALAADAASPAATAAASPAPADTTQAPFAAYPPYPPELIVNSELRFKANLVQRNLKRPPELVFFGGSRSQRFDPVFAKARLGLRSVNVSLSCARAEAAWGYLNWFYHRWPNARIRWIWGTQSTMLRDRDLDPALLQDPRFYRYFPDDLLADQRAHLPDSVGEMPKRYGFLTNRYSSRGMLLWNMYDRRRALGYTLDQSLDAYIAHMLHLESTLALPDTRAREYFEKTIALLNEHDVTPVIVIMPIHPRVLRVMKAHNLGGARQRLRDYLAELGQTASIKVLDFTRIQTFHGKSSWFYDGVHITRRNANRVIVAIRSQARDYLK
jgi:hypothetical protein